MGRARLRTGRLELRPLADGHLRHEVDLEQFDEPVAGHEEGEVEYEILREDWVSRS